MNTKFQAVLVLVYFSILVAVRAVDTVADSQKLAVKLFPELGVQGSQLHSRFMALYDEAQKNKSSLMENPRWPIILAEQAAQSIQPVAAKRESPNLGSSNFVTVKPFSGVTVDIPAAWVVVDPSLVREVLTAAEAVYGIKGVPPVSGVKSFKPPVSSNGVGVTIISREGKFPTQEMIAKSKTDDLAELSKTLEASARKSSESMGLKLNSFSGITIGQLGGNVCLKYIAQSSSEDMKITIETYDIPMGNRMISLQLTDLQGVSPWRPILARASSTLKIETK